MAIETNGYSFGSYWVKHTQDFAFGYEELIKILDRIDVNQFYALYESDGHNSPHIHKRLTEYCILNDPEFAAQLLEDMAKRNNARDKLVAEIARCKQGIKDRERRERERNQYMNNFTTNM